MPLPARLQDLYTIAAAIGQERACSAQVVFEHCGLLLQIPPRIYDDWCTPKDVLTFADIGGDGVHYSYPTGCPSASGAGPILMTVPAARPGTSDVVIAESFDEFFGLGC
jgi:hypothetical protein